MKNASPAISPWQSTGIRWPSARWDTSIWRDLEKALYWTERAARHGDWDGQCNLAWFYETGTGVPADLEKAKHWYQQAALQGHEIAHKKCVELGIPLY